jgi:hypothetical protein
VVEAAVEAVVEVAEVVTVEIVAVATVEVATAAVAVTDANLEILVMTKGKNNKKR